MKQKLSNSIWITRKCRINASERLLSNAKLTEFLNIYYSIFVLILSLLSFIYTKHSYNLSIASTILSLTLTISITYANTIRFRERSENLKINYIEMQSLLHQLELIKETDEDEIKKISTKYAELLKSAENHLAIDMYKQRRESQGEGNYLSLSQWGHYFSIVVGCAILKIILLFLPILVLLVVFM